MVHYRTDAESCSGRRPSRDRNGKTAETGIFLSRQDIYTGECLYLLSADCSLSSTEIVRIYGNRWSIECFFKTCNSLMKLGTEFQSRSYDAKVSHTTIVFTRYIILEWIRRNENDQKTYGELFYMFCDDKQDMYLTNALQSLMALFVDIVAKISTGITDLVKSKVIDWIRSQALFIQALFKVFCWES